MIAANYMNSSKCYVDGEHDREFEAGRRLRLFQAGSGNADVAVVSSVYNVTDDRTEITVSPATVFPSLAVIQRGATSANSGGEHNHTGQGQGGLIPAALLSQSNVLLLLTLAGSVPDEGDVLRGTSASLWEAGPPTVVRQGTAAVSLTAYQVCFQDTSDSGKLKLASSALTADEAEACALARDDIESDATGSFHLRGPISNPSWTFTPGAILWLSDTEGEITEIKPSTGYATRLGRAWTATEIDWNPMPPEYMGGGTA